MVAPTAPHVRRTASTFLLLAIGAVLLLVLPAAAGAHPDRAGSAKLTPVRLLVDFFPGAINGPTFAAIGEGYFAQQGLDVSLQFSPTAASTQNLIAGQGDIAYAPTANFLAARQKSGVNLVALYAYQQTTPMAVLTLQKSGITTLAGLKGKTVVDFAGSATQIAWPVLLKRNKIDPSSINMQLVSPAARVNALVAGQVDAMLAFWPDNGPLVANVCQCTVNTIRFDDYGVHLLGNAFATTPEYISAHPDILRRFFRAITEGALFAQKNQAKTVDDMINIVGATAAGDRNVGIATLKNLLTQYHSDWSKRLKLPLGAFSPADWKATLGVLVTGGFVQNEPKVTSLFTNQFVPCYTDKAGKLKWVACPVKKKKK